jgi:2-polyprenyl-6-hydroxyphenyl methylase/3-demethylubiquinone-9 3-methyltransferase
MTSINIKEIEKFAVMKNKWWDISGEFKILHQITPLRVEFILSNARRYLYGELDVSGSIDVLDVGCGGGILTSSLAKFDSMKLTGIDPCKESIEAASDYAKENNLDIKYIQSTVEDMVKEDKQYHVVICSEVIEHVENPKEFCDNLAKLVKPKGILVISTINRTIQSYITGIEIAENILNWIPKGTHEYRKFLRPSEISKMLESNNFEITNIKGINLNIIMQEWRFSSDRLDVNYILCARKLPDTQDAKYY